MPGMRTSMITTSGRRRSASATALSPSDASPITRMWGARESERRRPSRTTSWSSTIRQVISRSEVEFGSERLPRGPADCRGPVRSRLDRELRAARVLGRLAPDRRRAPICDLEAPREVGDLRSDRLRVLGREIGPFGRRAPRRAARARASRRPRCSEEVLPRPGRRKSRFAQTPVAPASRAARTTSASCSGSVGDARQDRRHPDARLDPRVDELLQRAQPLARVCGRGLGLSPDVLVERRDRERDADRRARAPPRRARRCRGRSSGRA